MKLEAIIGVPPEKDDFVIQIFEETEGQFAEVERNENSIIIEIYPTASGNPWRLNLKELINTLNRSYNELDA